VGIVGVVIFQENHSTDFATCVHN